MPDFTELFTSGDFTAYQDAVINEVVGWMHENLGMNKSPEYYTGGIAVAKRILSIPAKLKARPDVEKRLQAAVEARLVAIPAEILRKELLSGR